MTPLRQVQLRRACGGATARVLAEEVPVALMYDGVTHAVMMASPCDLTDFAVGFSLAEGIAAAASDILGCEALPDARGIVLQMRLAEPAGDRLAARRRHLAGPVGCGLCGVQSIDEAVRPAPRVGAGAHVSARMIVGAMALLRPAQVLNREAHALHAAGFWRTGMGNLLLREDVGRHNALDKLAGALARRGTQAGGGMVLLSSRVSVEMVQKTARMGAAILVAVSAPTALAVRVAEESGMTLVGVAREDGFEVFTHPERVLEETQAESARQPMSRRQKPSGQSMQSIVA